MNKWFTILRRVARVRSVPSIFALIAAPGFLFLLYRPVARSEPKETRPAEKIGPWRDWQGNLDLGG